MGGNSVPIGASRCRSALIGEVVDVAAPDPGRAEDTPGTEELQLDQAPYRSLGDGEAIRRLLDGQQLVGITRVTAHGALFGCGWSARAARSATARFQSRVAAVRASARTKSSRTGLIDAGTVGPGRVVDVPPTGTAAGSATGSSGARPFSDMILGCFGIACYRVTSAGKFHEMDPSITGQLRFGCKGELSLGPTPTCRSVVVAYVSVRESR